MVQLLVSWIFLTLGMALAAHLLPRMTLEGGVGSRLLVSGVFGVLFTLIGWAIHLALGVMTLGLLFVFGFIARLIAAAIVLKITDALFPRLRIDGFGTALAAALIISLAGSAARLLFM